MLQRSDQPEEMTWQTRQDEASGVYSKGANEYEW